MLQTLARNPADRFQGASDFGEALTRFLFSKGLAVSRNDISRLVKETVSEQEAAQPKAVEKTGGIIDALIQEEILKFTSLDDLEDPLDPGARPLSPEDISVMTPLDPGDFIDPRAWASDLSEESDLGLLSEEPAFASSGQDSTRDPAAGGARSTATAEEGTGQVELPVPEHRKPSPPPRQAEKPSSTPAVVWILLVLALLAAAGAALVLTGTVKI